MDLPFESERVPVPSWSSGAFVYVLDQGSHALGSDASVLVTSPAYTNEPQFSRAFDLLSPGCEQLN